MCDLNKRHGFLVIIVLLLANTVAYSKILDISNTQLIPTVYASEEEYHHLLTLQSPNPETNAWFGYQIEMDGDLIVVNEPFVSVNGIDDAGKVYLFDTDGNLLFTLQSPSPGPIHLFGHRVDIRNEYIIVGSQAFVNDIFRVGRAYVFSINGTYLFNLTSPEKSSGAYFSAYSVSLCDDFIVVSETKGEGAIHFYDYKGSFIRTIHSPSPIALGKFGRGLEVDEKFILVGEYGQPRQPRGQGKVYVFDHNGTHLTTLQAPEPEELALYGYKMSISGDRVIIGEPYATVNGLTRAGKAYIYNTNWELLATLISPNPKMAGNFGYGVEIDGDTIVIGEWDADVNPGQYEGRAYVYDIEGNLLQNLTAPSPCPRAAFGLDVAIDGDLIAIGECWANTEFEDQAGFVQLFTTNQIETVHETVEETVPFVEEAPDIDDNGGWIPGFPIVALFIGVLSISKFLVHKRT